MKTSDHLYKKIVGLALATACLLLIPLVAMQFTDEVVWTLSDFIFAGTLLFSTGLTYILVTRVADNVIYQAAVGLALATALFLVWANLAVGLIGSEDNSINLMYFGVLAVATIGTIIAHFKPHGMSLTLFATMFAQMLVALIALIAGMHQLPFSSVTEILGVNGFFAVLWCGSALLFRYVALNQQGSNIEPTA